VIGSPSGVELDGLADAKHFGRSHSARTASPRDAMEVGARGQGGSPVVGPAHSRKARTPGNARSASSMRRAALQSETHQDFGFAHQFANRPEDAIREYSAAMAADPANAKANARLEHLRKP
jgi:hypothetical protein